MNLSSKIKIIFSIIGTIFVLWNILLPGYVLSLDMIFGPKVGDFQDIFLNNWLLWFFVSFSNTIFPGWIVQKIILISLVFILFYLPTIFLEKIIDKKINKIILYSSSLFFAVNPFVYERLLIGQWKVVFGYALLIPAMAYLLEFCRKQDYKNMFFLLGCLTITSLFSTHFFVISVIISIVILITYNVKIRFNKSFIKKSILLVSFLFVLNIYWLSPVVFKDSHLDRFQNYDLSFFKTSSDDYFGTIGNVILLHGLWIEEKELSNRFSFPKDNQPIFLLGSSLLFLLILFGIYDSFKYGKKRFEIILLTSIAIITFIFSVGVGNTVFKDFNQFLFDNVFFWIGFRDSQKWSGFLILIYSIFFISGSEFFVSKLKNKNYKNIVLTIIFLIPILITPNMFFGLNSQLDTVFYPNEWSEVNSILKQDESCKALFLPWHQYYELRFNNNTWTANTSNLYFDCELIYSKNPEIGFKPNYSERDSLQEKLDRLMFLDKENPELVINFLKKTDFKYIIFTDDFSDGDPFLYNFINSESLHLIYSSDRINLLSL